MNEFDFESDEVTIWYRPRVRLWLDKNGDLHLAGEPDGIARVVDAFRVVARGIQITADVQLRTDPIPPKRNPVSDRGVKAQFEVLSLRRDRNAADLRASMDKLRLEISFSERTKALLGFALLETLDGEGDFNIPVLTDTGAHQLWFWGYSNPHGVNGF